MTTAAVDETIGRDAHALQEALTDLIRVYRFRDHDAVCCHDVSIAQSHALERLAARGPMTLNEFAASLYLEKSSASRLADGLARKGYVERSPNPEDARSIRLALTPDGRELHETIERDLLEERARILAELSPDERKVVVRSIARLAEAAAAQVDTSGGCCVRC